MALLLPRTTSPFTQTAVLALIPQADPAVAAHRARLQGAARWGVPAHVTVLYPFVAPDDLDDHVLARLAGAVATVPAFDITFARTAWFDDQVLWLAPDPAQPFHDLTAAVAAAFPDHPPYAGAFADPTPHLTIGESALGGLAALQRTEHELMAALPLHARVERVHLLAATEASDSWALLRDLPLS